MEIFIVYEIERDYYHTDKIMLGAFDSLEKAEAFKNKTIFELTGFSNETELKKGIMLAESHNKRLYNFVCKKTDKIERRMKSIRANLQNIKEIKEDAKSVVKAFRIRNKLYDILEVYEKQQRALYNEEYLGKLMHCTNISLKIESVNVS